VRCTTADSNKWVDAAGLQEHWAKLPDRDDIMDIPLLSKPCFKTINNIANGKKPHIFANLAPFITSARVLIISS
jgi:hypothetical protein